MHILLHFFAACGTVALGLMILTFAACAMAFAGGCLGGVISVGWIETSIAMEESGQNKGAFWGCMAGLVWALYCIFSAGLGTAFLATIGLVLAVFVIAGVGYVAFPGGPGPAGAVPNDDDYPY